VVSKAYETREKGDKLHFIKSKTFVGFALNPRIINSPYDPIPPRSPTLLH
jgi:hypothetical protein